MWKRYKPSEEQLSKDMGQVRWSRGRSAWNAFNKREQLTAEGRNPVIWYHPDLEEYSVSADPADPARLLDSPEDEGR